MQLNGRFNAFRITGRSVQATVELATKSYAPDPSVGNGSQQTLELATLRDRAGSESGYGAKMALQSVYLSARFERREELNGYRVDLEATGVAVTSRWLTDPTPELTDDAWRNLATKDVEDIRRAEGLVLFTEPGTPGGGGRHVEFGIALGLQKRMMIVGEPENLFHRLEVIEVVSSWEGAFKQLTT